MGWVYAAFWRLSNARPLGLNGPTRIPVSEIESYCRLLDLDYSRRQDLLFYVERLDNVYMAFVQKTQEEHKRDQELRNRQNQRNPPRR